MSKRKVRPVPHHWDETTKRFWLGHEGVIWQTCNDGKVVASLFPVEYSHNKEVLLGVFASFDLMFETIWYANEKTDVARDHSWLEHLQNGPDDPADFWKEDREP